MPLLLGGGGLVQVPYILSGVNSGQASKERKLKHLEMYLFEKRFGEKNAYGDLTLLLSVANPTQGHEIRFGTFYNNSR